MSRVTRFAARDEGPAPRVVGFVDQCRANGLRLGVAETETALRAPDAVNAADPAEARLALRAVCNGCADEAARFDALFDGYWMNGRRVVTRAVPTRTQKIADNLADFARRDALGLVDGRTVVFILSDGYDSSGAGGLGAALARIKRHGCRIVWLNPLKGRAEYAPIAGVMAEALPHLDVFHAANTLASLAALETELGQP